MPAPPPAQIVSIAQGAGLWVAGLSNGTLLTSPDTITWTAGVFTIAAALTASSLVYGNGTFVGGSSSGGTGDYAVSASGASNSWTFPSTFSNNGFFAITFDGTRFVAAVIDFITTNQSIATSLDGQTWTTVGDLAGLAATPTALIFTGSKYVLANDIGTVRSATTPAGLLAAPDLDIGFGGQRITGLAFGNGRIVAVGAGGQAAGSNDAVTWALEDPLFGGADIHAICYGKSIFVAVGNGGLISTRNNS